VSSKIKGEDRIRQDREKRKEVKNKDKLETRNKQ
jgi:hypothetical protein